MLSQTKGRLNAMPTTFTAPYPLWIFHGSMLRAKCAVPAWIMDALVTMIKDKLARNGVSLRRSPGSNTQSACWSTRLKYKEKKKFLSWGKSCKKKKKTKSICLYLAQFCVCNKCFISGKYFMFTLYIYRRLAWHQENNSKLARYMLCSRIYTHGKKVSV